jgi:hypothetical protein
MFHLVENTFSKVEDNLIHSAKLRDSWFSMWFNIIALMLVLGGFGFFLYSSYNSKPPAELQTIPFKAVPWMNAVRNVPTNEYGQLPETEIRGGIQGIANRSSASTF